MPPIEIHFSPKSICIWCPGAVSKRTVASSAARFAWRCGASTRCNVRNGTSTSSSASSRRTTTPLPAAAPSSNRHAAWRCSLSSVHAPGLVCVSAAAPSRSSAARCCVRCRARARFSWRPIRARGAPAAALRSQDPPSRPRGSPARFLLSYPSLTPWWEGVRISGARGSVYVAPDMRVGPRDRAARWRGARVGSEYRGPGGQRRAGDDVPRISVLRRLGAGRQRARSDTPLPAIPSLQTGGVALPERRRDGGWRRAPAASSS